MSLVAITLGSFFFAFFLAIILGTINPTWSPLRVIATTWGICLALILLFSLHGCASIAPDALSLDAAHTSHHWGSSPYEYGKDTAGIGEHWKRGPLSLDLAEYAQDCKDGLHPEFSAKASYVIPLK